MQFKTKISRQDKGYNFIVKDNPGKVCLAQKSYFYKKYLGFLILQNDTLASHLMAYEAWKSGLTKKNYPLV